MCYERFPCKKDETDLELALINAEEQARLVSETDIWLYGATGKESIIFWANFTLMLAYARKGYRFTWSIPNMRIWILQSMKLLRGQLGRTLLDRLCLRRRWLQQKTILPPSAGSVIAGFSAPALVNVFLGEEVVIQVPLRMGACGFCPKRHKPGRVLSCYARPQRRRYHARLRSELRAKPSGLSECEPCHAGAS